MGTSTDAYLYYGVDVYDPESGDNWLERPDEIPEDDWQDDLFWALEKYMKSKGIDVKFDIHCSGDFPIWFIYTTQHLASRGDPQSVSPEELIQKEDRDTVRKALDLLKAPEEIYSKIGWWLVSYWG